MSTTQILRTFLRIGSVGLMINAPGCTSARIIEQTSLINLKLSIADPRDELKLLWSQRTPGIITDLALAKDTGHLLVSMNPDPEGKGSLKKAMTQLLAPDGRQVWRNFPKSRVRAQAISPDGQFAVVTSYDEKVTAYDAQGRTLWQLDKLCRPLLLPLQKLIVCYFDDDSEPRTAFDLVTWQGKVLLSESISREILSLAVSPGGHWIAYALQGGSLKILATESLTGSSGIQGVRRPITQQLDGEVVDMAILDSAPSAKVLLLLNARIGMRPRAQNLIEIETATGRISSRAIVPAFAQTMSLSPSNEWGALYGNNPQGQGILQIQFNPSLLVMPRLLDRHFADFSSTLHTSHHRVIVGLENISNESNLRTLSHIIALDPEGVLRWSLDLRPEDAGYQIETAEIQDKLFIAVTTDSGSLSYYQAPGK